MLKNNIEFPKTVGEILDILKVEIQGMLLA